MALITKSIIAAGGGDFTTIQGFVDWVVANYPGAGWNAGGIEGIINDSASYAENVLINADIRPTWASPFRIAAGTGQTPTIALGATGSAKAITHGALWNQGPTGIYYTGLAVTGSGNAQIGFDVCPGANIGQYGVISRCTVTLTGTGSTVGVYATRGSTSSGAQFEIAQCKFKSCAYGVLYNKGSAYALSPVHDNLFIDCTIAGLQLGGANYCKVVYNNTFLRCAIGLIDVLNVTALAGEIIRNNIFRTCTTGISFAAGTFATYPWTLNNIDGNVFSNNTRDYIHGSANLTLAQWVALGFGADAHSTTEDPAFVSEVAGAENLLPTNAATLGGKAQYGTPTDYAGAGRVNGKHSTPGAYEGTYGAAVVPAGLAIADAGTDGELDVTWSNGGSYTAGDKLRARIYQVDGGGVEIPGSAVYRYVDATLGTARVGGFTNGTPHKATAEATSDNSTYSTACAATAAATPTSSSAPNAAFDVRLSSAVVAVAGTLTITGGITFDQNVTGVQCTYERRRTADGNLIEAGVASADFTSGVQKTMTEIFDALSVVPTVARGEYVTFSVANGTPAVTSETSQRFYYVVRSNAPTVVPTDAHTGAVSVALASNAGAEGTHLLYRKGFSDVAWTYVGTRVGDGAIADTVTLERWYEYIDYVSVLGALSPPNAPVPLFATANASREGTILTAVVALIRALNWTGWTTSQIERYLAADKSLLANMPRCAVCPGITPPEIQTLCNASDTHVYPVRIWLVNRIAGPYNDTLVLKAEQLKGLFRQRQVLNGITGVYDVLVRPLPVAAVADAEESAHVTGLDLLVLAEEDRQ